MPLIFSIYFHKTTQDVEGVDEPLQGSINDDQLTVEGLNGEPW